MPNFDCAQFRPCGEGSGGNTPDPCAGVEPEVSINIDPNSVIVTGSVYDDPLSTEDDLGIEFDVCITACCCDQDYVPFDVYNPGLLFSLQYSNVQSFFFNTSGIVTVPVTAGSIKMISPLDGTQIPVNGCVRFKYFDADGLGSLIEYYSLSEVFIQKFAIADPKFISGSYIQSLLVTFTVCNKEVSTSVGLTAAIMNYIAISQGSSDGKSARGLIATQFFKAQKIKYQADGEWYHNFVDTGLPSDPYYTYQIVFFVETPGAPVVGDYVILQGTPTDLSQDPPFTQIVFCNDFVPPNNVRSFMCLGTIGNPIFPVINYDGFNTVSCQ